MDEEESGDGDDGSSSSSAAAAAGVAKEQKMKLYGIVLSVDGKKFVEASGEVILKRNEPVPIQQVEALGIQLAANVREQGADALLGRGGPRPITYSEVATN